MKKGFKILVVAGVLTLTSIFTSFAGQWEQGENNIWKYKDDNGNYVTDRWMWIDDDNDGIAECYCFLYGDRLFPLPCMINEFSVNNNGQWVIDDVVQTRPSSEIDLLNSQISEAPIVQVKSTSGWMKKDNGVDKFYIDPTTGVNLTGWHELPRNDGGIGWFYFGEDGLLYRNRITPDGYIVDSNGVMYDENIAYKYDWSTLIEGEYGGYSISDPRFVRHYFNDFPTEEMSMEEFKNQLNSMGAEVISAKQKETYDDNYFYTGYTYDTYVEIQYKGLRFGIASALITPYLSASSQMWVIE